MNKTICCMCGKEYKFIDDDTPEKFAMVCSDGCLARLRGGR